MPAVLDGLLVVELSSDPIGSLVGMMMADHGADVVKVEPPMGSPVRREPGARVWDRAKRSVVLDIELPTDREAFLALVDRADVLIDSGRPGAIAALGMTSDDLSQRNPRLIHCSITPYGGVVSTPGDDAPGAGIGYEALVAARLGLSHEQRGWYGTPMDRIQGLEGSEADLDVPAGAQQGPQREGPLMITSRWASLSTALNATAGISAALFSRARTGQGQLVETTMLQGVLAINFSSWQRPENIDAPLYRMWVLDRRGPKGLFECADGRWVHQWPMNPFAVTEASHSDNLDEAAATRNRDDIRRLGMSPDDLVVLLHYFPHMVEAHKLFPAEAWVRFGSRADVGMQLVRSPEEALVDPDFVADATVVSVADAELGILSQVGLGFQFSETPGQVRRGAPRLGEHTAEVLAELTNPARTAPTAEPTGSMPGPGPLAGLMVLDLGLGVAGPFGTHLLADMGANVIKVNTQWDMFWLSMHMGGAANRGKRSLSVNLKDPRGLALVRRLAVQADVVAHNMRTGAAERLGLDYASLVSENPKLIFCHSRGFDHGPRLGLPGTDQTAGALCGTSYLDGGVASGGAPFWSPTSMGDTGNGWLSAIGILQALYNRERTGRGQQVDTAIVNACLLATSNTYVRADGSAPPRAELDAEMTGFSATHRFYGVGEQPGTDDWLVIAALEDHEVGNLLAAVGLEGDSRFASAESRTMHDTELEKELEARFLASDVATWVSQLQAAGVPCEHADAHFSQRLFDDEALRSRGWTTTQQHPVLGKVDTYGRLIDFAGTPSSVAGPAPLCGQHSREILGELGLDSSEIDELVAANVVLDGLPG